VVKRERGFEMRWGESERLRRGGDGGSRVGGRKSGKPRWAITKRGGEIGGIVQ